jgi:hypothetical protein
MLMHRRGAAVSDDEVPVAAETLRQILQVHPDSGSGRRSLERAAAAVQAEHDLALADGDHGHSEAVHLARLARLLQAAASRMADVTAGTPVVAEGRAREAFGHRALSQSGFGPWACRWCQAHGTDRGPDPSEVPCDTVDQYLLTRLRGVRDREAVAQGTLAEITAVLAELTPSDREQYEVRMTRRGYA